MTELVDDGALEASVHSDVRVRAPPWPLKTIQKKTIMKKMLTLIFLIPCLSFAEEGAADALASTFLEFWGWVFGICTVGYLLALPWASWEEYKKNESEKKELEEQLKNIKNKETKKYKEAKEAFKDAKRELFDSILELLLIGIIIIILFFAFMEYVS